MASEPTDSHDEVKRVTLRIFIIHDTANIARSNLEAHGIECWISADDCAGWYTNLTAPGGVRLLVRAADAERAMALLEAEASPAEINQIEAEAVASAPPKTVPLKNLAWGQIAFGIITGVILCLLYQSVTTIGTKTYHHRVHGKIDKEWLYRDERLAEFSEDRNLDGMMDHWAHYDQRGELSKSEYDNNFDGKADELWTFSDRGADTVQRDTDFNGVPDEFSTYKNEMIQQVDMKPNGSKFITMREIFQNGVLTEIWRGGDSEGHFKDVVRYDPFFNPISTNIPAGFELLPPVTK